MLDDCASFPIIALCLSYNKCRAKNLYEQMFANILHSRAKSSIFKTNKRSKKTRTEGVHMNTEEKKEKIRELIDKIEDDEMLSFIYKLIKRLMD